VAPARRPAGRPANRITRLRARRVQTRIPTTPNCHTVRAHPDAKLQRPAHLIPAVDPEVAERCRAAGPGGDVDRALDMSAFHHQQHLLRDVDLEPRGT
jgi:hypothetical protein